MHLNLDAHYLSDKFLIMITDFPRGNMRLNRNTIQERITLPLPVTGGVLGVGCTEIIR